MNLLVKNISYDEAIAVAVILKRDMKPIEDKAKAKGKKTKTREEIISELKKVK